MCGDERPRSDLSVWPDSRGLLHRGGGWPLSEESAGQALPPHTLSPQASSKDTGQLYAALHHRILALRSRAEQEQEAKVPAPEPGATRAAEEEDSDEDAVLTPSGVTPSGAGEQQGTRGRDPPPPPRPRPWWLCAGSEGPALPTGTGDEGDGQTPGST